MQKFSEFIQSKKLNEADTTNIDAFNELYESTLSIYGVTTPLDLDDEDSAEFWAKMDNFGLNESDIKSEKEFREYAMKVLKKAHPDDFDEKTAKETIEGIAKKVKNGDWGEAVGRLTSSLG